MNIIQELNKIKTMQVVCNESMTQVFNAIKNKKIDLSKMEYIAGDTINPPVGTLKWYNFNNKSAVYCDYTDVTRAYFITILIDPSVTCCGQNPVQTCICTGDIEIPCINTFSLDITDPTSLPTQIVPSNIINNAIATMPIVSNSAFPTNLMLGLAVLVIGYIVLKK